MLYFPTKVLLVVLFPVHKFQSTHTQNKYVVIGGIKELRTCRAFRRGAGVIEIEMSKPEINISSIDTLSPLVVFRYIWHAYDVHVQITDRDRR